LEPVINMRERNITPEIEASKKIPNALRTWFIIHFIVDILFAIPLMFAPTQILTWVGWQAVDPLTTRLTAAALFGIGIESLLGRNGSRISYKNMLRLKIIWSFSATVGIAISIAQVSQAVPIFAWLILALFAGFNLLWVYWYRQIK
jgi:hypothetical protein